MLLLLLTTTRKGAGLVVERPEFEPGSDHYNALRQVHKVTARSCAAPDTEYPSCTLCRQYFRIGRGNRVEKRGGRKTFFFVP